MEDVDWAIQYLYAQNVLKGVAQVPADSAGPSNQEGGEENDD